MASKLDLAPYESKEKSQIIQMLINVKSYDAKKIHLLSSKEYDYILECRKYKEGGICRLMQTDIFFDTVLFMYSKGYDYEIEQNKKGTWCIVWIKMEQ